MKPALPTNLPRLLVHPWIWRMAWRDSRRERQRLAVFAASIVVGIAALVSIHALRASLERGIALQARELLGSDLQISARLPFDEKARAAFAAASTAADYETNFTTMMTFPSGEARLVQLRLLGGQFPFYGKIATRPADAWPALREQTAPVLFLEPALLDQFGVAIGDSVRLGEADLVISGTVLQTAPRTGRFAGFAPDVYANRAALDATGLLGRTSLAGYHAHLQLPDDAEPSRVAERLAALFPDVNWEIETADSRRDQIGEVLNRFEQFLSLIALFSLVLGAIGVASAMHAQIRRRRQSIAILRCLGLSSRGALAVYFVQAAVLGILATIAGALLGVALHAGIVAWFREDLPVALALLPPAGVILRTASVGFLACLGFALLPLLQVRDIPPLAVLRDNSGGLGRLRLVLRALPEPCSPCSRSSAAPVCNAASLSRSDWPAFSCSSFSPDNFSSSPPAAAPKPRPATSPAKAWPTSSVRKTRPCFSLSRSDSASASSPSPCWPARKSSARSRSPNPAPDPTFTSSMCNPTKPTTCVPSSRSANSP